MDILSTNPAEWQIIALKYDNRQHYTFPTTLIEDDGEQLRLKSIPGAALIHYTRGFREQTGFFDATFWRHRWYNVFTNYNEDRSLRDFYCNVAMPPVITVSTITQGAVSETADLEKNTLSYVDLDLDLRVHADSTYEILDEDEFVLHSAKFGYPDWLQRQAQSALDELIALLQTHAGPFQILDVS
jgi:protein associated with RNAse G/E